MKALDSDHKLTQEMSARIRKHLVERQMIIACCVNPSLAPLSQMHFWPVMEQRGEDMIANLARGIPVVVIACASCGSLRPISLSLLEGRS